MLFANLFSGWRDQVVRKKNSTGIRLPIPFRENIKILIKTLTVSIYPKSSLKQQKPAPKLQTPNKLKCLKLWELTPHKYLTNIYLCWEFVLPFSTLLRISWHFNTNLNGSEWHFLPPIPRSWFSLNNPETVKTVNLAICSINLVTLTPHSLQILNKTQAVAFPISGFLGNPLQIKTAIVPEPVMTSNDTDVKLAPVTKLDKTNTATSKILTSLSFSNLWLI